MSETRKEYTVVIGGLEHTVLLSDDDARAQGLKPNAKAAPAPENKARKAPANKAAAPDEK